MNRNEILLGIMGLLFVLIFISVYFTINTDKLKKEEAKEIVVSIDVKDQKPGKIIKLPKGLNFINAYPSARGTWYLLTKDEQANKFFIFEQNQNHDRVYPYIVIEEE